MTRASTIDMATPGGGRFSLAVPEVERLWSWLQDGSILRPAAIRARLRRGWGLCPRHTWAHAAVECELRLQPFSTAALAHDLVMQAAEALRRVPQERSSPAPVAALTAAWAARPANGWRPPPPATPTAGDDPGSACGSAATTNDRAALVEALGWLTGWGLVEHIARTDGTRSP